MSALVRAVGAVALFGSFGGLTLTALPAEADGPPVNASPVAAQLACLDGHHQALVTNALRRGVEIGWEDINQSCRRTIT